MNHRDVIIRTVPRTGDRVVIEGQAMLETIRDLADGYGVELNEIVVRLAQGQMLHLGQAEYRLRCGVAVEGQ